MVVRATQFVRKMRGAAQAHLLRCDDGHEYVVKFRNNPQHPRVLLNEWIGSVVLNVLRIPTPETCFVDISAEFLAENPQVHIELHSRRGAVVTGWHFGSRYLGHADETRVYDFIPDSIMERVANRTAFLGALVFDKWTGNADARQAIFVRPAAQEWSPSCNHGRPGFTASMIDQGYTFGGPAWTFYDSPLQGLYFRPSVYRHVHSLDDFEPWLDRVVHFPEDILYRTRQDIPADWIDGEESRLDALLTKLLARRARAPDLISAVRRARVSVFPEWKEVCFVEM
jgi:hypothetical protein